MELGINNINVRFFVIDAERLDEADYDGHEVNEVEWCEFEGEIEYQRHSVFENGCRQICLTKSNIVS